MGVYCIAGGALVTYAMYIQMHFRLDFIRVANTMNFEQTAPDLCTYCLQYRLPLNIFFATNNSNRVGSQVLATLVTTLPL